MRSDQKDKQRHKPKRKTNEEKMSRLTLNRCSRCANLDSRGHSQKNVELISCSLECEIDNRRMVNSMTNDNDRCSLLLGLSRLLFLIATSRNSRLRTFIFLWIIVQTVLDLQSHIALSSHCTKHSNTRTTEAREEKKRGKIGRHTLAAIRHFPRIWSA